MDGVCLFGLRTLCNNNNNNNNNNVQTFRQIEGESEKNTGVR